jgi:hypothetical protein
MKGTMVDKGDLNLKEVVESLLADDIVLIERMVNLGDYRGIKIGLERFQRDLAYYGEYLTRQELRDYYRLYDSVYMWFLEEWKAGRL